MSPLALVEASLAVVTAAAIWRCCSERYDYLDAVGSILQLPSTQPLGIVRNETGYILLSIFFKSLLMESKAFFQVGFSLHDPLKLVVILRVTCTSNNLI
jgi:hypothetical protein